MCSTPAPPSTLVVAHSIWSGVGEVNTSPGHAASSIPPPPNPPCRGPCPHPPPHEPPVHRLVPRPPAGDDPDLPLHRSIGAVDHERVVVDVNEVTVGRLHT